MIDGALVGWPQWVRVPWLRGIYFPFWRSLNAMRRACRAAFDSDCLLITHDQAFHVTEHLDEHPDDWPHVCMCAVCRDHAD